MAKNKKYWKTLLAGSDDKKHAAQTGEDPLEEGLKQLTWFESSRQAVRRGINKTYETFGEEVGNSITERLTPDQKVVCSNHVGVTVLFWTSLVAQTAKHLSTMW